MDTSQTLPVSGVAQFEVILNLNFMAIRDHPLI